MAHHRHVVSGLLGKAARAIAVAVAAPHAPLRLPLGADAVAGIRQTLASIASDVGRSEAVATATSFDDAR